MFQSHRILRSSIIETVRSSKRVAGLIRSLENLLWNPWFEIAALLVLVVLLLSLNTIDHRAQPLRFWSIAALCPISVGIYMLVRFLLAKSAQRESERWHNNVRVLVGADELLGEDTDVFDYLDPDELEQVFTWLESAPRESRSLRKALEAVTPDTLDLID